TRRDAGAGVGVRVRVVVIERGMPYTEERDYTFRLELRCEFPDDYDGEADGYAWAAEIEPLAGEMLRAIREVIARHPQWSARPARPASRGRCTADDITLVLTRKP